jgi:Polyketide cyclase / dehydrase and lipid transport
VPGVASTSNVSGPWDRPGSTRIVHLRDGSTVNEGLTDYDRPTHFAYRVSEPTFSLKHLMSYARGQFWLAPTEAGTQVKWTYSFRARNGVTKLPLMFFAKTRWKGYMDVCLRNVLKQFAVS